MRKPETKKRKVEEAVVLEDIAKPIMKKRKKEEEAGSPRGSAPILPHGKKNISKVSAIKDMEKPKVQNRKKEKARSPQGVVPTLPSTKKGQSTAAQPKSKKTTLPSTKKGQSTAAQPKSKKTTLPTKKKGLSTAPQPKTKKSNETKPPGDSAPTLPTANKEASFPRVSVPTFTSAKKVQFAATLPEIIPHRRNMEDLWQAAFPVGTEWDKLDTLYKIQWDFSNLENALEEGGLLYGKKVYLFGCTEPQLVPFENQLKVVLIPVTVAVVSSFPPSDKIGIKSVQMEGETVVPMKEMKMDWVPYVPFYDRSLQVGDMLLLWDRKNEKPGKHKKFNSLWLRPYIIQGITGPNSFHLSTLEGEPLHLPANGQMLKLFFRDDI